MRPTLRCETQQGRLRESKIAHCSSFRLKPMPLSPGTALQNGHYVVDALLETAPNGDLYCGTHVVTGMPVFIQVFPVSAEKSGSDLSRLITRLQGLSFSPESPLPNPFQLFRGNEETLCLAMGNMVGLPWSSICKTQSPLSSQQALRAIRQIADSITWLQEQGLSGLDLSPNRVWMNDDSDRIRLTGLPLSFLTFSSEVAPQPNSTVPSLARLLYSFLTGELPPTDLATNWRAYLHQQLPELNPLMVEAIGQGVAKPTATTPPLLAAWLNQLPDATAPHLATSTNQQPTLLSPSSAPANTTISADQRRSRPKIYSALGGTALLAAIAGTTLGTVWRLNAQNLPGAIKLEPNQSFPNQSDWSGDRPNPDFEAPFEPSPQDPLPREERYEPEPELLPQEEFWEAPANAAEWPEETTSPAEPEWSAPADNLEEWAPSEPTAPAPEPPTSSEESLDAPNVPQDFSVPPIETPIDDGAADFSNASDLVSQNL